MSVGVCIINKNGIALAADSAITFTGDRMFYNSMNKLFSLSKKNICGAIIYGTTNIYNIPLEQILKEFGTFLDQRKYVDDFFEITPLFIEFIKSKNNYYKFNIAEKEVCKKAINDFVDEWGRKLKVELQKSNEHNKMEAILDEFSNDIDSKREVTDYDVSEYIRANYAEVYETSLNNVVPEIQNYLDIKEKFWKLISKQFNVVSNDESAEKKGIFFAGYGKNDAFPKYINIELYTVVNGEAKLKINSKYEQSNLKAQIVPLAQIEEIEIFCRGISNYLEEYIPKKMDELIIKKINELPKEFSEEQKKILIDVMAECKGELKADLENIIRCKYINPIMRSVPLILLPEMAVLAENLVNITSLKRTFALDGLQQTVGGPTDVAVISKSDGFIWIKQKAYFDKRLKLDYSTEKF